MSASLIIPPDINDPQTGIDVDDVIKPPPRAGTGLHPWLFGQACRLKELGATPEEAEMYIRASLDKHQPGRDVFDRELRHEAVRNAFAVDGQRPNGPSWPKPTAKEIKAIVERQGAFTLDGLKRFFSRENVAAFAGQGRYRHPLPRQSPSLSCGFLVRSPDVRKGEVEGT